MNRASQAWGEANISLLKDLLNRHWPRSGREDLRGFEWFYWWREANAGLYTIAGTGSRAIFMPNGKLLAILGPLADPWFWDLSTERAYGRVRELRGADDAAFSPDSKLVALAGDYDVRILPTDSLRNTYFSNKAIVLPYSCSRLRFAPDGSTLVLNRVATFLY